MNPPYNVWLTTLESVQNFQSLAEDSIQWDALQISILRMFIQQASMQIVTWLQRLPLPNYDTRTFDFCPGTVAPDYKTLMVDDDLLTLTTVTNGNSSTISSSNYVLTPNNTYPKRFVRINNGSSTSSVYWRNASDGRTDQVISLTGLWGYVPHYGREWQDSGIDVPVGGLTSSATTLALGTGQGASFQIGEYLRIGTEFLWVSDITTDTLTLERGALGSTAAAHDAGDDIDRYQQLWDIQYAATEWAAYLFKAKDRVGDNVQIYDNAVQIVNGLSPLVKQTLNQHRYLGSGRF